MPPLMIYQNDPRYQRKSNFANRMLQQGTDTSPVQHPAQAWARLAQGLVGGYMGREANQDLTDREDRYRQTLADSLTAATKRGPDVPGVADKVYAPEGNLDAITPPPTQGAPGGMDALISALQGNPDTADMAFKARVSQLGADQSHGRALELMRAKTKAGISAEGAKEEAKLPSRKELAAYKASLAPFMQTTGRDEFGNPRPVTIDRRTGAPVIPQVGGQRPPQSPGTPRRQGPPSAGEKKIDEVFATKVYVPWVAEGGRADAAKNLGQIEAVIQNLGDPNLNLSGPVLGNVPKAARNFTNPQSVAAQERVEEVVQRNLRVILGAQFTEKEGKSLIARAYNPALEEPENAMRLRALQAAMEEAMSQKDASVDYFNKNRTLRGFKGTPGLKTGDITKIFESKLEEIKNSDRKVNIDALLDKYAPQKSVK